MPMILQKSIIQVRIAVGLERVMNFVHAILLDLEVALIVVMAVTYLLSIRSRHDASIATSISAQYSMYKVHDTL